MNRIGSIKIYRLFVMAFATIATLSVGMGVHEASASANLLVNGDFTIPTSPGNWTLIDAGSTALTGWTVDKGNVDVVGTGYAKWVAPSSGQSIDLNGGTAGTLSQTFATTAGTMYKVSFQLSGNNDGGVVPKSLELSAGDQQNIQFTYHPVGGVMQYFAQELFFTALNGTTSTLTFRSLESGSQGAVIAMANVSAVPIPGAALLLGSGLLGLIGIGTRKKQDASTC